MRTRITFKWTFIHAERAFVGKIQEQREDVVKAVLEYIDRGTTEFCPAGSDGQVRRAARRFLLSAAAGELAAKWGILPWPEGAATEAIRTCFNSWLEERGGCGAQEDTAIIQSVRLFLELHGQSRFQDIAKPDEKIINRAGFRFDRDGQTYFLVLSEVFRTEVCRGHNLRCAVKV